MTGSSESKQKKQKSGLSDGYIQVYTGNGKGKTTAALGLALRAAGHGLKTFIGQFLKGRDYGELHAAEKLRPLITIKQFGKKGFIHVRGDPDAEDIQRAEKALSACREAMLSGKYSIVILDEICIALYFHLLAEEDVLELLRRKPKNVELVLTGRYAPESIIAAADLVTEMKEVKHYYQKGIQARKGFEK
ncbi:MAG: cob(I)yrinic acid a,c-diamide adenosyltransferase [Candidatus Aminicenantes bacterium]|nr:cob(I)yrinic acid a,c-diamide adenosyltransferase [Candidatus Aminicenantes bacterium]